MLKTILEIQDASLYFREREVWFCHVGLNLGHEQDGRHEKLLRPVIVLRKFNKDIFLGLPLTSKVKNDKFHYRLYWNKKGVSWAILSQIRLMDRKRLFRKIGMISELDNLELKKKFIALL